MGSNIRENFCIYKQYNTFPNAKAHSLCSSVVWGLYIDDIVHGLDQESVSIKGAVDEGIDHVAHALASHMPWMKQVVDCFLEFWFYLPRWIFGCYFLNKDIDDVAHLLDLG